MGFEYDMLLAIENILQMFIKFPCSNSTLLYFQSKILIENLRRKKILLTLLPFYVKFIVYSM